MFTYCGNNPIVYIDNAGTLFGFVDLLCAAAVAVVTVAVVQLVVVPVFTLGIQVITEVATEIDQQIQTQIQMVEFLYQEDHYNTPTTQTVVSGEQILVPSIVQKLAKKPINLPSFKKLGINKVHIESGHMPGGSRNPNGNKTVFYGFTAQQVYKAIEEAHNNSHKLKTQGWNVLIEGYSKTYNLVIRMWVNVKDYIIETAYPKP